MKLFSWGSNSHGQLGQGGIEEEQLYPTQINIDVQPKLLTGGGKHSVLVTSDSEIFTCGDNDKGQLGKGLKITSLHVFKPLKCSFNVLKVSCGWDFNLALTDTCEVFGWGSNSFGQLGLSINKISNICDPHKLLEEEAVDIGAGLRHSAIVVKRGLIFTSGFGRKGQLGFYLDNKVPNTCDKFTQVENIKNCERISCGESHCIAVTKDGLYSWGSNRYGQLGINPQFSTSTPKEFKLNAVLKVTDLQSGWAHNCILTDDGQVITWGRNDFGQLGEKRQLSWKPQAIRSLSKIKQVCLGSHHTIALTEEHEVLSWGWNEHGNCGNGSCENVLKPYKLEKFTGVGLIGSGAAQSFLSCEMNDRRKPDDLEIIDFNSKPTSTHEGITEIPTVDGNLAYSEFFRSFLLTNKPCLINDISRRWPCVEKWIKNRSLNVDYFREKLANVEVPVSDCGKREFNVQKKFQMKLFEYLEYWEDRKQPSKTTTECLYLKDWHFVKQFPREEIYRVPPYFASDWLNEYYDNNPGLNDDYKFVYIGPKGSWTPLHADVFTSYSWSVNICGRKRWILLPPGAECHFKDNLGNLNYDLDLSKITNESLKNKIPVFEIIQEEGQGLFVPTGWHHQVWNLEDTISINHNWINGCNVHHIWHSLQRNLTAIEKEISDCREMENWTSHCQLILSATFGFNYRFFHSLLVDTARSRMTTLRSGKSLSVYGKWYFGKIHMIFDLKRILKVLETMMVDENFLEISKFENSLNESVEFLKNLRAFLDSYGVCVESQNNKM